MSFSKAEIELIEGTLTAFLRTERPPVEVRPQLDYAYIITEKSVELHEVRPRFDDVTQKMIRPFARATYSKTRDTWRVYWVRADLKWHPYHPEPIVSSLDDFLALVKEDEHACFHG